MSLASRHALLLQTPSVLLRQKIVRSQRSFGVSTSHSSPVSSRKQRMDEAPKELVVTRLKAIEATPESFREFGQVIGASPDGAEFGPSDAQLELHRGIPRFYIMHLEGRELKFSSITHHASVTQCLGSVGGGEWYLGVAKASLVTKDGVIDEVEAEKIHRSQCGHHYIPPVPDEVRVFRISGPQFLKLNLGTWHAGPLFKTNAMDFYNLELSNTNVVDHTTHSFRKSNGVTFIIDE